MAVLVIAVPPAAEAIFYSSSTEISERISELESEINSLPQPSVNLAPWTLGYRSEPQHNSAAEIEIALEFQAQAVIDLVVLIPATYTVDGQRLIPCCFPERFKIEAMLPDGSRRIIADHSDADYHVHGIEPQLFQLAEGVEAAGVILTITQLARNETWMSGRYRAALSELLVFSGNCNVALNQAVSANSITNYSYVWTSASLVDGFSLFSPIRRHPQSPNLIPLRISNVDEVEIVFDLGELSPIDEYRFWPLVHDLQFNFPPSSGIGFPLGLAIQVAHLADFSDAQTVFSTSEIYPVAGSNPLMLRTPRHFARFVKMRLSNIVYDYRTGLSELAIDEIQVLNNGQLLSGRVIPALNGAEVADEELQTLTDGQTSEGKIQPLRQWLIDIARRAEQERTLQLLQGQLAITQLQERERVTFMIMVACGLVVIMALLVWLVYLLSEKHWNVMRERIASDIHDDLGANMISVAHNMELLRHSMDNASEGQTRLLNSAISTAHDTAVETRQIVHLLERAEDGSSWTESLNDSVNQQLQGLPFSLQVTDKQAFNRLNAIRHWDLLLFIKEALNNIIKHANATEVEILLTRTAKSLAVIINDNGRGISTAELPVRHLQSRARRLNGTLQINTAPGQGTKIQLVL